MIAGIVQGGSGVTDHGALTGLGDNDHPQYNSLLAEYVVSGSAVTSIDFSGLDINTHKSYRIEIELTNSTASGASISCYINGDTVATNYYHQYILANATTLSGARANSSRVAQIPASSNSQSNLTVALSTGYGSINSIERYNGGSSMQILNYVNRTNSTIANITQLTFTSSVASSIGIGSKIRIYRGDV